MKVAVVGTGAVGGYFGGRLAAAGANVSFIARGAHLDALRRRGLRIESPFGNLHLPSVTATDDPTSIGAVDVVFFTVKLYDTEGATRLLPPLVGPDTAVVSFQNGVESVDVMSRVVGRAHTVGGTAFVSGVVAEPGVIRHTANDTLVFGELDGSASPRLTALVDACRAAGFKARLSNDIDIDIWSKFVWLSVFSGVTAVTRLPVGPLREDPDLLAMCHAAAMETMAVAHARGVHLTAQIFEEVLANLQRLPPHAKSSMLEDLERGRRLELAWLSGAVVRIGEQVDVPTPIHRFITTVLRPHAEPKA
jgi:2-dehydropantoate 2-reductase